MGIKEQTVSACTYADLIGIVALRIIEIGDQSARFGFLPLSLSLSLFPFFLPFIPALRELAYREQEVITYVFANYAMLRVIMRRIARKEIGETVGEKGDGYRPSFLLENLIERERNDKKSPPSSLNN